MNGDYCSSRLGLEMLWDPRCETLLYNVYSRLLIIAERRAQPPPGQQSNTSNGFPLSKVSG
ncbi:hypothetical protein NT6N_24170 [Oceaniferula spumae]|uniref:Uncharacterized protein n=1 Tax=Oceaniferula spumae TaxID=2979115 RepID=A0AAT9FN36_9BACT